MKNIILKYPLIIIFVITNIFFSCKKTTELNEFGQTNLESLACDSMKDISDAFPKIEKYHSYKLSQIVCSPKLRTLSLIYFTEDSLSNMYIDVRDIKLPENSVFLKDAKQRFDLAQGGEFKNKKVTKILGEYASFSTIYPEPNSKNSNYITSFQCILKEKYVVNVLITQNKSPVNFESFFKEYVTKIDTSKLK